jgi:hypothetical protein
MNLVIKLPTPKKAFKRRIIESINYDCRLQEVKQPELKPKDNTPE